MEKAIAVMASLAKEILAFVRGPTQGKEIGEVERRLVSMVMAIGRAALVEFVAEKGTGYTVKENTGAHGHRLPYVRDRNCAYGSIFGTVPIRRAYRRLQNPRHPVSGRYRA